jgi:RNA polymerase sigma factor for flagellar operon FliA
MQFNRLYFLSGEAVYVVYFRGMFMDAAEYYADHVKQINEAISIICRKHAMQDDEEKDFAQQVHLQLIENDYRILRSYKGNSSLKTYLHTVISRIFIDQVRVKWHPSAEAKRMGEPVVALEKLIYRDQYTLHEACQILAAIPSTAIDENAAHDMLGRLHFKTPRLNILDDSEELLRRIPDPAPDPETRLAQKQLHRKKRKVIALIGNIILLLSGEEKLLIKLLFIDGHRISEIARLLRKDDRQLYKRTQSILRKLREAMADAEIAPSDLREVLFLSDEDDV